MWGFTWGLLWRDFHVKLPLLELKPPELCPPKGPELARPWWLSSGPLEGGKKWWGSGLGVGRK